MAAFCEEEVLRDALFQRAGVATTSSGLEYYFFRNLMNALDARSRVVIVCDPKKNVALRGIRLR
jgi:hypothetical protein